MTSFDIAGIIALIIFALGCWCLFGLCWVMYLDLFGRRYDYDKDYSLSRWQLFKAGPLVWLFTFFER